MKSHYLQGIITVDDFMKFSASGKLVALVQALRKALNEILMEKLENPRMDHSANPVMNTVYALLNTRGGQR